MVSRSWRDIDELLDTLVQAKNGPGNLYDTLEHIAHTARQLFTADVCVIFPINPITGHFIGSPTITGNLLSNSEIFPYEQPGEGLAQQSLKGGGLLIEDIEGTLEYHSKFTHAENIRSLIALPLHRRQDQHPLGVLYLHYRQPQLFNTDERNLLEVFAEQASFLLQETWLLLRYQKVAQIGQEINHDLATADVLFQKLRKGVPGIVDTQHTLLLAVHQSHTNRLELHVEEEGRPIFFEHVQGGACRHVMDTQEPVFIENFTQQIQNLPFQIARLEGTTLKESFIFVPLVLREVALGVLSVQHPQPYAYTQEDLSILQLLANHIALALSNMHLYDTLRSLHETGQLLTQRLDSGYTLQATVDQIREATQADLVVIYAYEPVLRRFVFPPSLAGNLRDANSYQFLQLHQPDDIATSLLHQPQPIFMTEGKDSYPEGCSEVQLRQNQFQQREEIRSIAVLPLQVGDEPIGVMFVNFRQQQYFDSAQKLFIEGLAHYAAIAIKNGQEFDTLYQRRFRDLETLQNIDRELNRVLDLKTVLKRLLELACERVAAHGASIWFPNSRTQVLEGIVGIGSHSEIVLHPPSQGTEGITQWVAQHKKSARVANVHRDLPWCDLYVQIMPTTISELDVPLLDEGEVIGVLNFESARENAFRQEDEDFLYTLAGQAVLAIKKTQAYEREKRLADERKVLNDISKEIISQLEDHHQVFDLILEKALELTHSETGVLMLYDAERNDLWMAAERGVFEEKKGQRHGLHQGVVGHVARHKELLNIDLTQPPWNGLYLDYIPDARSELAVPMLAGNELRGVLNIESTLPANFSGRDERLLEGLADLAVVALQHAELYAKADNEARRFSLLYQTGKDLSEISELAQLEQAYDIVMHMAASYRQSQVIMRRYEPSAGQLILKRQRQQEPLPEQMDLDEGVNGQVVREKRTIKINDIEHLPAGISAVKLTNTSIKSLLVTPIRFKEHFYGTLGLNHHNVGHFRDTDIDFFEGLAQQLAITIYRLETVQARQESEQRAQVAETLGSVGHIAFELTHRWDNDLGLVPSHVNFIRQELERLGVSSEVITKELGYIVQGARRVLNLSRELKHVTASGAAMDNKFEVVPVAAVLAELQEQVSLVCPPTVQINVQIDEAVHDIEIIPRMIIDCLRNLATNAIDAMPHGGQLMLQADNDAQSVAIKVIDTGIGIPEDMQLKIFKPFFSTKKSSGFGLWSASTNASKNHGELKVESYPGEGTTFTLLLPGVKRSNKNVVPLPH